MKIMFLFWIFAAVFEGLFGVLGGIRVVKAPSEIREIWHQYNTDQKELDWDKQVERNKKIVKCFLPAVGYFLIAFGCHIFLSKASKKIMLQSEQRRGRGVGRVSATLIDKKDAATVNITVTATGQPVTVTVQPVIQSTEAPPCYHI